MKKVLSVLLVLFVALGLVGCGGSNTDDSSVLKVSATLDPHSKILEEAKVILKEDYNIDLQIQVLDDYYVFNKALVEGDVDANYFQHLPFFDGQIAEFGYEISNVGGIHLEPFGFYSQTISNISELKDGAEIIISNSPSDFGRILGILAEANLITLKDGVTVLDATLDDIIGNTKNLKFTEIKPELLALAYNNKEGDLVAINGNYALQAGLNPTKDAVLLESASDTNPYVNIVAVKTGNENDSRIKALVEVLKSERIKTFIETTYEGSVIPAN